ncbi:MAG: hypothetical protein ACRC50_02905 [Gaiella sp.]
MTQERAPWWRRRLGPWGAACAVLVLVSIALGVPTDRNGPALAVQGALLVAAAACYLVGLVRSPD